MGEGPEGKSPLRQIRRHHRFRMRRRAARLLRRVFSSPQQLPWLRRAICRRGDTYCNCSGLLCCGNSRRWGVITLQEEHARNSFEEQLEELRELLGE